MLCYKLLRLRKNGTLGSLFIDRKGIIPTGVWLKAKAVRTRGYAFRPGWHCCAEPLAPHLSKKGRVWCVVDIRDYSEVKRPQSQGGLWYLADRMKLICPVTGEV